MSEIIKNTTTNTISTGTGGLQLDPAGTDIVTISNGLLVPDGTKTEPAVRFTDDNNTGIYSPTNDQVSITGQGEDALLVTGVASAVNVLEVKPSVTTSPLLVNATGSDTNISINIVPKGSGSLQVGGTSVSLSGHTHTGTYEPADANIQSHLSSTSNPHSTTADQVLPTQTGNTGKFVTTDGTNSSWGVIVDDASTTSTTLGWSASKLNTVLGDVAAALTAING